MSNPGIKFGLIGLVVADLAMVAVATTRYPGLFSQPGARGFVIEPVVALVIYAVAISFAGIRNIAFPTALAFGTVTGVIEIINIGTENGIPFQVHGPTLQICIMLTIFIAWGIAGGRATRLFGSIATGVLTAASAAGICMLMGVTAGFAIQFFLVPPSPAYVATWAEYKRSGWTDAQAFGLANVLDSGFTHLMVAPVVAILFGGCASLLSRSLASKSAIAKP